MSSFTSYIPEYQTMDRLNPGRKRTAPRINDFDVARHTQTNSMFFNEEDDGDSIFGSDEPTTIDSIRPLDAIRRTMPIAAGGRQNQNRNTTAPTSGTVQSGTSRIHRPNNTLSNMPRTFMQHAPETIEIKEEMETTTTNANLLESIPLNERVRIYIGRRNRPVYVRRSDLSKSPILLSYIVDDPTQGAFIMRPQLMSTHVDDFEAVSQYLRSGEYSPMLLENPQDLQGPKILDGLRNDEEYGKELIRCGKLSGLARHFGVEGMSELVFRKVSEVDPGKFNIYSLVRVAEIVFKNGNGIKERAIADAGGNGEDVRGGGPDGDARNGNGSVKDPLEEWIIGKLAHNFQEIMRSQSAAFWEAVKVTNKKLLFARVLDEVADRYRATGGKLPEPVIELD